MSKAISNDAAARITTFVESEAGVPVGLDDRLFLAVGLSSLFAMKLVVFVERVTGLELPGEELNMANFQTIRSVMNLIERLGDDQ